MVPKITRGGTSFKAAFRYYLHDKGAETQVRIEWAQTENMRTPDPAKAWKVMAHTAQSQERLKEAAGMSRAGRKLEKPVFAFSLAWHPEQAPSEEHMLTTARAAIDMLGLTEHEAVIVSHKDEPQKHVHVVINRVHPITGMAGDIRNSKRKFSDFAREYEHSHGKVYCLQRESNHKERKAGKSSRYCDPHILEAWNTTQTGQQFVAALAAKGYRLAQGRKRLVVIDPHRKAHNPIRHLKGVRSLEFTVRLRDLDFDRLPDASAAFSKALTVDPEKETRWKSVNQLVEKQTELKERQKCEYEDAHVRHVRQMQTAKSTLVEYYELPQRKKQLQRLKKKIDYAPWWHRLFGITRKDRKMLSEQAVAYKFYVTRYREKVSRVEKDGTESLEKLQKTHWKDQMDLKLQIDIRRAFADRGPVVVQERTRERPSRKPTKALKRDRSLER